MSYPYCYWFDDFLRCMLEEEVMECPHLIPGAGCALCPYYEESYEW